jgi:hypothetical protein
MFLGFANLGALHIGQFCKLGVQLLHTQCPWAQITTDLILVRHTGH